MLRSVRHLLLAGGTVAVLGLAAVGAGGIAAPDGAADRPATSVAAAADALLAADTTTAPPAGAVSERLTARQLRRLAAWRHLVHAQATLDLPALGGLTTVQLDHGTIASVSATSLTIAEAGGGSATVVLDPKTKVRRDGASGAVGDLRTGDEVFAMSLVEGASADAYLVVVPKP